MQEKECVIINKLGLHARAAAKLVGTASKFISHIEINKDERTVNAKSIMGVMMLAASQGTLIKLSADGEDAEEALNALMKLIEERFGEAQ